MLVIKIELHSAVTKKITLIGQAIIHNVGGTSEKGDYEIRVGRKGKHNLLSKVFTEPLRIGEVKGHPRLRQNVWRLVLKALASAFPEEKFK